MMDANHFRKRFASWAQPDYVRLRDGALVIENMELNTGASCVVVVTSADKGGVYAETFLREAIFWLRNLHTTRTGPLASVLAEMYAEDGLDVALLEAALAPLLAKELLKTL